MPYKPYVRPTALKEHCSGVGQYTDKVINVLSPSLTRATNSTCTSLYSRSTQDPERVGLYYVLRFACPVNEIAYNLCHGVTELRMTAVLTNE